MVSTQAEFLAELQTVDAYAFERFVAELWELQNWDTVVTTGGDDGGVDVIAEQSTPFPKKQVIQVKRYEPSNSVGRPDIQQYASIREERTDVDTVVVVTTGGFTDGAEEVARKLNVKLIDGARLYNLIQSLDAVDLAKSYITPGANQNGTSSNEAGTPDESSRNAEPVAQSQSLVEFTEEVEHSDVPRHLPSLVKLREHIVDEFDVIQSDITKAENAFEDDRYFDAVETYEAVNSRRLALRRDIARYDAGLTHLDGETVEQLPATETFTTQLARVTERVNEQFQDAFRIAERAKGLELLVVEIHERVAAVQDDLETGDQLRQNADVEGAHSKYKQAEQGLDAVRETMEIYEGLVASYSDAVVDSHSGLADDVSLSDLESKVAARIHSKSEIAERRTVAEEAAGSFDASVLTDNSGELFEKDLIEYLREGEHLEFVFTPPRMGFKIAGPTESDGAPQHDPLESGSSFLVVTDQRVLYVGGVDDHDETQSLSYEELSGVTASSEGTAQYLQITSDEGRTYRFEGLRTNSTDLEPAASYIREHVE